MSRQGSGTGEFRYKAFISYSWADRRWGEWLHHALETYRAPKGVADGRTLQPVFKDREEEAAGASIGAAIETALGASEYLVVICSPNSATSKWVNHEVAWFKTRRDPKKILTLIVEGEPLASQTPGREAEECFPRTLLYKVGADFLPMEEFEAAPLAADAREAGDGKRGSKLKLAAAMLGVGYDALARRDNKRRTGRRRLVYAGLGSLSLVLGGLSVFAFNQRHAAVLARNDAVAAQKDAEFQRDEAQGLVEYMVTDLREILNAVGRLDVLESVGVRLADFYRNQNLATLDPNALGRRARVQLLLGEVDNTRGNLDAALARYKEAAATTEELLKRNPDSAQQLFDHAQSVFWVGYIAWQRGDAKEAKKYFTQYKDYADQLVAIDPDKEEWRMEVKYALGNLGTLAMDQGEAAEAETYFRKALAIIIPLSATNPNDISLLLSSGQAYAWLADSLHRQAKLAETRDARRSEIQLYESWSSKHPDEAEVKQATAIALSRLAHVELAAGNLETASKTAVAASAMADEVSVADIENTQSLDRSAITHSILGEVDFYLGRRIEARASLTRAINIASELVARDDAVALWSGYTLSQPRLVLAKIEYKESHDLIANRMLDDIIATQRRLIDSGSRDPSIIRIHCAALAEIARHSKSSKSEWLEIISILAPNINKQPPDARALLAEAYARTNAESSAKDIASDLYAAGYRHPDFVALLDEFPDLKTAAIKGAAQ